MTKYLYNLDTASEESKNTLGGKGYYLSKLNKLNKDLGLSFEVPSACIIPTQLWQLYAKQPKKAIQIIESEIIPQIKAQLSTDGTFPLVSVRSGAPVSMPGMMDTVLNLGINMENVDTFAKSGTKAWAYDCLKRYLSMYAQIVLGIDKKAFHEVEQKTYKTKKDIESDFTAIYKKNGHKLPGTDVDTQLKSSIVSVLESWNNERAKIYRKINNIDDSIGTAIVVQKMVFGNKNDNSATAVIFSRDTNDGSSVVTGEYLINAQGEDVVAGVRTGKDFNSLRQWNETLYEQIRSDVKKLETHFKDVQDVELTIEDGKLYFLQARTAKRTPQAAIKIAINMVEEGIIEAKEVFSKVSLDEYLKINTKQVDPGYNERADGQGLSASSGVLIGQVVFDLKSFDNVSEDKPTILLAKETTPDDMPILKEVSGVLTAVGGVTSHAAVVARSLNKVAIVGCEDLKVNTTGPRQSWHATIGGNKVSEGDLITIDAPTGRVWIGNAVPIIDGTTNKYVLKLEDMVFDAFDFIRAVSTPDDIFCDKDVLYATYRLDSQDYSKIKEDLFAAIDVMQSSLPEDYLAIIDLQGKLDFITQNFSESVPFTDSLAKSNFEDKANVLLSWSGAKDKFKVYLGKYEQEYASKFTDYGFTVLPKEELKLSLSTTVSGKNDTKNKNFITIVDTVNEDLIDRAKKKVAISGKNALMGLLKK